MVKAPMNAASQGKTCYEKVGTRIGGNGAGNGFMLQGQ